MFPKWLKDANDNSNNLLTSVVKKILEDTNYAASMAVDSNDEDDEQYEEEVSCV